MDEGLVKKCLIGLVVVSLVGPIVTGTVTVFKLLLSVLVVLAPCAVAWYMNSTETNYQRYSKYDPNHFKHDREQPHDLSLLRRSEGSTVSEGQLEIRRLHEKIKDYRPGKWTVRDAGSSFEKPSKVKLGVFGMKDSGKSAFLNSLHFAYKGVWEQIYTESNMAGQGETIFRDPAILTDQVTTFDTPGQPDLGYYKVWEVMNEITGKRGINPRSWATGERIDCPIFILKYNPTTGIQHCHDFISSLVQKIRQDCGSYPIMVVTFANSILNQEVIVGEITRTGMEKNSLFFIENYTASNHEMDSKKHIALLKILEACIKRADDNITFHFRKENEQLPRRKCNAQILIADRGSILFAPIPRPVKENNIFDAEFRRISLRESSVITSMDYDPIDRMVYYVDVTYKVVERNNLNGTARHQLQYSYIVPSSVGVDSVGRRVYYTISNQATIYYRDLGDLAVTYELPSTTFPSSSSRTTIAVDGLASYLLYTAFGYAQLISYRLGSQPVETRSLLSARTSAFTIEPCKTTDVNSSARVYYYKTFSKELGYANTFQTWNRTIQRLPDVASVNSGMAKYGNKLFFVDVVNFLKRRLIEYDTKASSLKIHNTVTVKLDTGGNSTITPDGIRVLNIKYTEPVSIEDCPMNISVKINSSSIYDTRQVSWTEPSLNAWSNCATLEFLGPGTNGGNFSKGVYNISYEASDLNGNTDTCSFTVTVEGEPDDEPSTEASPSSSPSISSNDSTTDTSGSAGGDDNAPCSNDNPASGNGAKVSCTFIQFVYLVALLVTVFK